MNLVDGVLWVMMGLSGLLGLIRGVVKEGFSLLGWFLGFMFSSAYAHGLSQQWPLASWPWLRLLALAHPKSRNTRQ